MRSWEWKGWDRNWEIFATRTCLGWEPLSLSWLFLFCNVFIVDLQLFEICLVAKDVLWQILNHIFRQIPENFKGKCIRTFRKFRKKKHQSECNSREKKTVWGNYRGGPRIGQFRTQGGGKGREREREREREMWEKVYWNIQIRGLLRLNYMKFKKV